MSALQLIEDDAAWQRLVGKAIVRFGDIELVSLKCLAHIPQDKIEDAAATLEFGRRVALLVEILEARDGLSESLKAVLEGFKRAKVLSKIRNLIAHNPVLLDLYTNEGQDLLAERTIRSARSGGDPLTFDKLTEFADEVDNLASHLWMHYMRASSDPDPLWRRNP